MPVTFFDFLDGSGKYSLRPRAHGVPFNMSNARNNENGTETMTNDKIETQDCPRCSGRGHIDAFAHYADGVCFLCKGGKTIQVNISALIRKVSPASRKQAEYILAATSDTFTTAFWTYAKLLKARNFCHGGWGLGEAFPKLYDHWFATGEAAFQVAQEAQHVNFYAND